MDDRDFFHEVRRIIEFYEPEVKVVSKNEVWYHKLIAKVLFFTPYMSQFSTTIGKKIALADDHWGNWNLLAHEGKHVLQAQKQTTLFHSILYLFPQILGILGPLIALMTGNYWWLLLMLLFATPIPAYYRMKKELEAYSISVMLKQWRYGYVSQLTMDYVVENFTGPAYFFMWPFADYVRDRLWRAEQQAVHWDPLIDMRKDPYLNMIYLSMKEHGLLHEHAHHLTKEV